MLLISSASNPEVHLVLDFSNLGSFWLVLLSSQLLCWYHSVSYCLFLLLISLIILHFFHILSHYPMCYSKKFYSLQHLVFHYTLSAFKGVLFVAIWLWQPGTCPCILGMLGKRPSYEVPVSFIPLLSIYLFNITTLIWGIVNFRLHCHQCFYPIIIILLFEVLSPQTCRPRSTLTYYHYYWLFNSMFWLLPLL